MAEQPVEGKPLDVFAAGMVLWELVEGRPPAASLRDQAVLDELVSGCKLVHCRPHHCTAPVLLLKLTTTALECLVPPGISID